VSSGVVKLSNYIMSDGPLFNNKETIHEMYHIFLENQKSIKGKKVKFATLNIQ